MEEVIFYILALKNELELSRQREENPKRKNNTIRHGGRKQQWIINSLRLEDRIFFMPGRKKMRERESG